MRTGLRTAVLALTGLVLGMTGTALPAAPSSELWQRWTAHDAADTRRIDHSAWSRWLERYRREPGPDGVARVDYARAVDNGRRSLDAYIERLSGVAISGYNRGQQLAYWLNLYNALTVDVVLEHYPVATIRDIDISSGWFSDGPWGAELVSVEGTPLTLNDIEHRILRPIWEDPRIHYGVNCASIGCPNLRAEAFTGENVDRLLSEGARDYVNDPRGVAFVDGELVVSSIYEWFQADFGGSESGVLRHLRRYADDELTERLGGRSAYGDDRYDWSLNDVR